MTLVDDVAVPRERLADLLVGIEAIAKDLDVLIACPGHAGDGNMHPTVIFPPGGDEPGGRGPRRVQARRPDGDGADAWNGSKDAAAAAALAREASPKGHVSGIVVMPAGKHQSIYAAAAGGKADLLAGSRLRPIKC